MNLFVSIGLAAALVCASHVLLTGFSDPLKSAWIGVYAAWGGLAYDIVKTLYERAANEAK